MPALAKTNTRILDVDKFRQNKAKSIQILMVDHIRSGATIGLELMEVRSTYKRGERHLFEAWLKKEVGIALSTADFFILIAKHTKGKLVNLSMKVCISVLKELTPKEVPDSAIAEIEDRVFKGQKVTVLETRETVARHKLPSPAKAREMAREKGTLVLASDNNYYTGATKEEAAVIEARRTMVYGVRRAVETLANLELTPKQFLDYALPHQLWDEEKGKQIEVAARWMERLAIAWKNRQ